MQGLMACITQRSSRTASAFRSTEIGCRREIWSPNILELIAGAADSCAGIRERYGAPGNGRSVSTAATSVAGPFFPGPRFVNPKRSTAYFAAVEFVDRLVRGIIARHLNKTESLGPVGLAIDNQFGAADITELGEEGAQIIFGQAVRKVTNINIHKKSLVISPGVTFGTATSGFAAGKGRE